MTRLVGMVATALLLVSAPTAAADGPDVTPSNNAFHGALTEVEADEVAPQASKTDHSQTIGSAAPPDCIDSGVDTACIPSTQCLPDSGSSLGGYLWSASSDIRVMLGACTPVDPQPVLVPIADPAQVTPGRVLQAFRRIPLPESRLIVQPPGGRTLVNFDTLFRTEAEPFTRTVTLLGQRVELDIRPHSFTWHHGDGTEQTTSEPGLAYEKGRPMSEYVSHQYVDADVTVRPSVDTTWTARFRVNGGPWQDVNGTVVMDGAAGSLEVVEARPVLTGTD